MRKWDLLMAFRFIVVLAFTYFLGYFFTPSMLGNVVGDIETFDNGRYEIYAGDELLLESLMDNGPSLQRLVNLFGDSQSLLQIPVGIRHQVCILVENYYFSNTGALVFIENGPIDLKVEVGGKEETITASKTKDNFEFCRTKPIELIAFSPQFEKKKISGIFHTACGDASIQCDRNGQTKVMWKTQLLGQPKSLFGVYALAFITSMAFIQTVLKPGWNFIFKSKGFDSLTEDCENCEIAKKLSVDKE